MNDFLQEIINQPEPELLDFDAFLIGDGSRALMDKIHKPISTTSFQLSGINTVEDLLCKPVIEKPLITTKNDLDEFATDDIPSEEDLDDLLFEVKKQIFDKFSYIQNKSKTLNGKAFREKDLVLTRDNVFLLNYLIDKGYANNSVVNSIGQLLSYKEMGFTEVKFVSIDDCPLCLSQNGLINKIDYLLGLFGEGKYPVHINCFCNYVPVIRKRSLYNGLANINKPLIKVDGKELVNVPVEFNTEVIDLIVFLNGVKSVEFVDLKKASKKNDVLVKVGETMYVHCDYVGSYSPLDYLNAWVEQEMKSERLLSNIDDKIISEDVYYLNGMKVVEIEGTYYDVETKRIVR